MTTCHYWMSVISQLIHASQRKLETLLGSPTFSVGDASFLCVPSTLNAGNQLEIGGLLETIELTLIVRKDILPTRPATGSKLTHGGTEYRVLTVNEPAGGTTWEINVGSKNR